MCEKVLLVSLVFFCFLATFTYNTKTTDHQQFVYLADAFLHGQLHFRELPGSYTDLSWYQGKFYMASGPFPVIILTPFVFLWGTNFLQGYIHFLLTALNFYLLFTIALRLGIKRKIDALWLAFAYLFGTMYLGVALTANSLRFAQVIATSLLLLAILEYLGKKRFWLIGVLMALAVATRLNLILGLSFFALGILYATKSRRGRFVSFSHLCAPVFVAGVFLLWYNYARFGNIFDNGYLSSILTDSLIGISDAPRKALVYSNYRLLSPAFIPTNLYYYFLKGPEAVLSGSTDSYLITPPFLRPDVFGLWQTNEYTSAIISAPIFFFTLLANAKEAVVRQGWLAALLLFSFLLLLFTPTQRYFLDLTPFLFVILLRALAPKISFPLKIFIVFSFLLNFLLIARI